MSIIKTRSSSSKRKKKEKVPRDYSLLKKIMGGLLMVFSIFLTIASISYFFSWRADQSILQNSFNDFLFDFDSIIPQNIMGKLGAYLAHFFIYNGFGIGAFFIYPILLIIGYNFYFNNRFHIRIKTTSKLLVSAIWISLVCALLFSKNFVIFSGLLGFGLYIFSKSLVGIIGIVFILMLITIFFLYVSFGIDLLEWLRKKPKLPTAEIEDNSVSESLFEKDKIIIEEESTDSNYGSDSDSVEEESFNTNSNDDFHMDDIQSESKSEEAEGLKLEIEKNVEETPIDVSPKKEHYGIDEPFDPRLDLSGYIFPEINFLNKYETGTKAEVSKEDLDKSKNMIVQTLNNYKIGIAQIKATIGPTVTLFEIVPEAGIRISKIKNLEDDIALSLAALGIRIIAPIPGKGTIGIEVPNKKPEIVSMYSVISSPKYQNSDAALPVCLGKTISNEVFVADLAKMPHLLMAGATGQGKSVGLNAIIVSLLYKKHPAELKFVMVDPKKVELTLYQTIERHYLAKLPGEGDAIITDNKQVITTLNSLCEEMDQRYALLQLALVRNIKEYNAKFKKRKLNPEEGHKYLPYIVVIIDEVADLIMTAGKEVEHPIGRIAQLARAIGIHLILATQRPSVNIITGTIKANFPARIAFRVSSKIDSRTILDGNGADQLIGKGDMLYSTGSDMIRLQCPFVDTPEVDTITGFIGNQRGYPDAHILPEVREESSGEGADFNPDDRDALFEDAARIVVQHQQGSTSLIQRRLKVGYNRAGRLIDQLEAANIVGPFEGSKARSVLLPDEYALEQFLNNL